MDLTPFTPTSFAASAITSGLLSLARGGTGLDASATGGAGQYLKQSSSGSSFSVAAILAADLPNHSADLLTSGTLADARLTSNVPLKNAANVFTASQTLQSGSLIKGTTNVAETYLSLQRLDNTQVLVVSLSTATNTKIQGPATLSIETNNSSGSVFIGNLNSRYRIAIVDTATGIGPSNGIASGGPTLLVYDGTATTGLTTLTIQAGAGQGTSSEFKLQALSTTTARLRGDIAGSWIDSTDATRKARIIHSVYDTAVREAIRLDANGSGAQIGIGGAVSGSNLLTVNGTGLFTGDVSAPNLPVILSKTTGIDAKTTGTTTLYTVPTGKTAIITAAIVRCTAASAITNGPTLGIGVAAGEDDIFPSTAITALTTTAKMFGFSTIGMSVTAAAASVIKLGLDTASTGTSQTLAVDLIGYLL